MAGVAAAVCEYFGVMVLEPWKERTGLDSGKESSLSEKILRKHMDF